MVESPLFRQLRQWVQDEIARRLRDVGIVGTAIDAGHIGGSFNGALVETSKSKVSSNDTTPGYLNGKLVAGTGVTLTENNDAGDETLTIAASGGAGSGAMSMAFGPLNNQPPASNYATLDTRNGHVVLDFTDDTEPDKSAIFAGVLSRNYGGGGITVNLHTAYTTATSGDAIWTVAFERIGDEQQDLDSDGFATAKSVTVTVPATSGLVTIDSIAFTDGAEIDSLAVGEVFRLKVTRDADNVADTVSGDGELYALELRETA